MKILIIDNGTSYLEKLKTLLGEHRVTTKNFGEIDEKSADQFDCVILSGGHVLPVFGNEKTFEKEIELIRNASKPLLGICFGFELIAHTFGADLILTEKKEKGIVHIQRTQESVLFRNIDTKDFEVYESHRWVVKNVQEPLIELARSKDGVEIVQHREKPLYGFQFHPEMFVDQTVGNTIFYNALHASSITRAQVSYSKTPQS